MTATPKVAHTPGVECVKTEAAYHEALASLLAARKQNAAMLAALERCVPWLGKMIADGGHMNAVLPNDAINALERAEAAIAAARGQS